MRGGSYADFTDILGQAGAFYNLSAGAYPNIADGGVVCGDTRYPDWNPELPDLKVEVNFIDVDG